MTNQVEPSFRDTHPSSAHRLPNESAVPSVPIPLGVTLGCIVAVIAVLTYGWIHTAKPESVPIARTPALSGTLAADEARKNAAEFDKLKLAEKYLDGSKDSSADPSRAFQLLLEVATTNSKAQPLAKFELAELHYLGYGTARNPVAAAALLKPLLEQKLATYTQQAINGLYGWMLFNGDGVPRDEKQAVAVWLSTDHQDHVLRRPAYQPMGLALAYWQGRGVAKDQKQARSQFERAGLPENIDPLKMLVAAERIFDDQCPSLRLGLATPGVATRYRFLTAQAEAAYARCIVMSSRGKVEPYGAEAYDALKTAEQLGFTPDPALKKSVLRNVGVFIGMTEDEVLASKWGKPERVNTTTRQSGTTAQWVYRNSFLYFENGVLTAIQN